MLLEENRENKIKRIIEDLSLPKYRLDQTLQAIYKQNSFSKFSQISNIPQELRQALSSALGDQIATLNPLLIQNEGETQKILFQTKDDQRIETVKMHYRGGRNTVCVSTQVGCSMKCSFCATGKLGLARNLSQDEITDQILFFRKNGQEVNNVVFMGMGEPFANPNTFLALNDLIDPKKLGIGQRHISISTVGIIPGIRRMATEQPQINLTLSLHSPFQSQREELMPISKKYPITDIMRELEFYILKTNRKVLVAYLLLGDVNDSKNHAEALAKLLNSYLKVKGLFQVNLINFHEVPNLPFKRSNPKSVWIFREILQENAIANTLRQDFGESIDAACGQLSGGRDRT